MIVNFVKKLDIALTNEEIEALKTVEKIFRTIESEVEDNDIIDKDEMSEIIGECYGEHYCYCSNGVSDIISEIIGLADC